MKAYGISYANIEDYKLRDRLSGGDIYIDVKEFAKIVVEFVDDYDDDNSMIPQHEYHNIEELIELLESFKESTYLYTDNDYIYGIIINIYNVI